MNPTKKGVTEHQSYPQPWAYQQMSPSVAQQHLVNEQPYVSLIGAHKQPQTPRQFSHQQQDTSGNRKNEPEDISKSVIGEESPSPPLCNQQGQISVAPINLPESKADAVDESLLKKSEPMASPAEGLQENEEWRKKAAGTSNSVISPKRNVDAQFGMCTQDHCNFTEISKMEESNPPDNAGTEPCVTSFVDATNYNAQCAKVKELVTPCARQIWDPGGWVDSYLIILGLRCNSQCDIQVQIFEISNEAVCQSSCRGCSSTSTWMTRLDFEWAGML